MGKIVVANLKMNMMASSIDSYLNYINKKIETEDFIVCPTSIYVPYFLNKKYSVGIQNVFFKNEGAYTGEVSARQARSLGIKYTIIGHSERRTYFDESETDINKKVLQALNNNLKVIFCVGETLEEKNLLKTDKVLKRQLTYGLKNIKIEDLENIYIAYEPVWSIGSGNVLDNETIEKIVYYIKSIVMSMYDINDVNVLYGGSVDDKNIKILNKIKNISGFLVGSASLDPKKITNIVKEVVD